MPKLKAKPKPSKPRAAKPKAVAALPPQWAKRIVGAADVPPRELVAHDRNWRTHPANQGSALLDAISDIGFIRSVTVNKRNNRILDGHLRVAKAIETHQKTVAVEYVDLTDEEEAKALLFIDPLAAMAVADKTKLDALLREVQTGSESIAALLSGLATDAGLAYGTPLPEPGGGGDEFDTTPDEAGPTRTAVGDLWRITGNGLEHKLLVGDCTVAENVARLMGGEKAAGVFTSPPYAEQRKEQYGGVPAAQYLDWWDGVQAGVRSALDSSGSFFVNIKPHCEDGERSLYVFDLVTAMKRRHGWRYIEEFVWKHSGTPKVAARRFKNQFEPIYHFAVEEFAFFPEQAMVESSRAFSRAGKGRASSLQGGADWSADIAVHDGLAYPGNVVAVNFDSHGGDGAVHPAVFPVGLPLFFIKAFSPDTAVWFDPFLGSGTTLIAAHRLGRKCYGCEIEPRYADVVLNRCEAEGLAVEKAP